MLFCISVLLCCSVVSCCFVFLYCYVVVLFRVVLYFCIVYYSVVSCCFVRHVLLGRVCFVGDFLLCVFCLYFIFRGMGVFLVLLHLEAWVMSLSHSREISQTST